MPENLEQKVKNFFSRPELRVGLEQIAKKHFQGENQRIFLYFFDLVKTGQNNIDDILKFLVNQMKVEPETALEINTELFDKIFADVYYDLADFYVQNQRQKVIKYIEPLEKPKLHTDFSRGNKNNETSSEDGKKYSQLETEYRNFVQSGLYQNAKNIEDEMEKKLNNNTNEFKNIFYTAINASDQVKTIACLFAIFKSGVKNFFVNDQRYNDFLNNFLMQKDSKEAEDFKQKPDAEKYIVLFIRLILEKKLKLDEQKSALIGIILGALSKQAGNEELADVAYGDERESKFLWENL